MVLLVAVAVAVGFLIYKNRASKVSQPQTLAEPASNVQNSSVASTSAQSSTLSASGSASSTTSNHIFYSVVENIGSKTLLSDLKRITNSFYKTHPDDYDFLIVVSGYEVGDSLGSVADQYFPIKNEIRGIGQGLYNETKDLGSGGKLKGVAFIDNLDFTFGSDVNKYFAVNIFIHELGHCWLMYLGYNTLKINRDGSHWSNFVDAATREDGKIYPDPMDSGIWKKNADGTFSGLNKPIEMFQDQAYEFRFNTLDLYLMGLLPPDQTQPLTLIIPNGKVVTDQNIRATERQITVQDLINLGGVRSPAYPNTQKEFTVGLLFVTKASATSVEQSLMDWVTEHLPIFWAEATANTSKLILK